MSAKVILARDYAHNTQTNRHMEQNATTTPHTHTHTHTHTSTSPPALSLCLISPGTEHAGKSEEHNLAPRSQTCGPPPRPQKAVMMIPLTPPPPLPLLTALFFYRTGNQTDSGALKPFLQLGDGERGPRTSLMQPPSPGLVSRSHLWKEKEGETEEEWGERWVHVCVCVCVFVCEERRERRGEQSERVFFYKPCVCAEKRHCGTSADKREEKRISLPCVISLSLWMRVKSIKSKWKRSPSLPLPSPCLFSLLLPLPLWSDCFLSLSLSHSLPLSLARAGPNQSATHRSCHHGKKTGTRVLEPARMTLNGKFAHASPCVCVCVRACVCPQKHDSSLPAMLMNKDDINP